MGCGASRDDIAEPRPMQSHGRDNLQRIDKEVALKPIDLTSDCICSLYTSSSAVHNNPSSPPSVFIHNPDSLSSDEDDEDDEDFDPSFDIPSKLSIIDEVENNASQTTALAALSGEKDVIEKDVEERVEAILVADAEVLIAEQGDECCALGMLTSQSAILQALLSTGPVITEQNLGGDFAARVGHVAVISGPEPIRWEPPLRKAEIIDLDKEPAAGESLMLENTPEYQENHSDQEPGDDDHALKQLEEDSIAFLTEEQPKQDSKPHDAVDTHKTLEPRKPKLPPLTIVPPILIEIPANPFTKPAFPIVIKQDLMEVKVPFVCETEQFEDPSADRTPEECANPFIPICSPEKDRKHGKTTAFGANPLSAEPASELEPSLPNCDLVSCGSASVELQPCISWLTPTRR